MKNICLLAIAGTFSLGMVTGWSEVIRFSDGTVIEGELGAPVEVTIETAAGSRRVPFALLSPEVQKKYTWQAGGSTVATLAVQRNATAPTAPTTTPAPAMAGPVEDQELAALAAEVKLETWAQVAAIGSFKDRPEKRGQGGLVVQKAFNALEENWATVYEAGNPVGQAKQWEAPVAKAKALLGRTTQFMQKRWLELFISAGEAVSRRDSNEFASVLREMKRYPLQVAVNANSAKFFTVK